MGYTHHDQVCGTNGLAVGAVGAEVEVATSTGSLKEQGVALSSADMTLTNKNLTTPIIPSLYQDAAKTKLMTLPNTASDTLAAVAATQTLTNKTLTSPVVNTPDMKFGITAAIDLSAADVTLNAAQAATPILQVTVGHAANAIIAPDVAGKFYWVVNEAAAAVALIKKAGGVAVTVAATKAALVYHNGTNYVRLTADQ